MDNYIWLNIASIFFGLLAWIFPLINIIKNNNFTKMEGVIFFAASLSSCAISLTAVIYYINYLALKADWSAIADTLLTFSFVSATLLIVTLALNFIWLFKGLKAAK